MSTSANSHDLALKTLFPELGASTQSTDKAAWILDAACIAKRDTDLARKKSRYKEAAAVSKSVHGQYHLSTLILEKEEEKASLNQKNSTTFPAKRYQRILERASRA